MNAIKEHIKNTLLEKLTNFETVPGGEQRTYADLLQKKTVDILFDSKNDLVTETRRAKSKRTIEDVTLISQKKLFYIDIKTHDLNSEFSMPNLTSINRIRKVFNSDKKELVYTLVSYVLENDMLIVKDVEVFFIWELEPTILSVGALGLGQLQIKDANKELIFTTIGKMAWYSEYVKLVQVYLQKQKIKIEQQILEWVN
jgi:hypothetical protein